MKPICPPRVPTESCSRFLQIGDRRLRGTQVERKYTEAALVTLLWIGFLSIGVTVLLWVLAPEHPLECVIFDVMSAQSNVGLDSGITGPTMPAPAKGMLIVNMLVGRLEIIPIAVLLRAMFRGMDLYN